MTALLILLSLAAQSARDPAPAFGLREPGTHTLRIDRGAYTLGYDRARGRAAWCAWHLSAAWLGHPPVGRSDAFAPDPGIPAGWYRAGDAAYRRSGFDRGHLCPSADRTASRRDNDQTFFFGNVVPQAPAVNRGPWQALEDHCRALVHAGHELHVVAGTLGAGGTGSHGPRSRLDGGRLAVPAWLWKAAIVLPEGDDDLDRVAADTPVIAVLVPNRQDADPDWTRHATSIDRIEGATGLDLFPDLPDEVEGAIEARIQPLPNSAKAQQGR